MDGYTIEAHLSQATETTDHIEPLRAIWIQGIRWGNRFADSCKYGKKSISVGVMSTGTYRVSKRKSTKEENKENMTRTVSFSFSLKVPKRNCVHILL